MHIKTKAKYIFAALAALLCAVSFTGCTADHTPPREHGSFKAQADHMMRHFSDPKLLATVNGHKITQVDLDGYGIDGHYHTTEELVRYYITSDYAKKAGLQPDARDAKWRAEILNGMRNDSELTDAYCRETYGVPLEVVISISLKRFDQIAMHAAYTEAVIDEISGGSCPEKHPQLAEVYEKYLQDKTSISAFRAVEEAHYEMIAAGYDVKIYAW